MNDINERVVFFLGQGSESPVLIIGIPKDAYKKMGKGNTQTLDLNKVGTPLQVILYGEDTHASAKKLIEDYAAKRGQAILDIRRKDLSIK